MIFWPDLASAHLAGKTLECLEEANMPVVARATNPPCTPHPPSCGPLKTSGGLVKQEVGIYLHRGGWIAKSDHHLRCRIQQVIRDLDERCREDDDAGVRGVRMAGKNGPVYDTSVLCTQQLVEGGVPCISC